MIYLLMHAGEFSVYIHHLYSLTLNCISIRVLCVGISATVESTIHPASYAASSAINGSATQEGLHLEVTSSIISSEQSTKKLPFMLTPLWVRRRLNAIIVAQKMYSCWVSYRLRVIQWLFCYAGKLSHFPPNHYTILSACTDRSCSSIPLTCPPPNIQTTMCRHAELERHRLGHITMVTSN